VTAVTVTKRHARDLFRAAKLAEQQLYPVAQRHHDEHGSWPGDYLQAQYETARAFERYADAGIFSGITVAS
jgi:hypothetical protein